MDMETFKNLVDDVAEYVLWIDLYNRGEPLLSPQIYDMIAYANAKNVATKVSSNLNILDDQAAEKMILSGLDHLVVAMDGASQESYSRYRVGGNLHTVIENVRRLVYWKRKLGSRTPFITLRVLLMRHNEHEIPAIRRIAAELAVDNLLFFPMFVNAKQPGAVEEWLPGDEEKSWYDYSGGVNRLIRDGRVTCAELWCRGVVNWDGSVYPCCFVDTGAPYGNVREQSFRQLWNSRSFVESRRAAAGQNLDSQAICAGCLGSLKRG